MNATLAIKPSALQSSSTAANNPELFSQLGQITRHLHDALHQLGVMPHLQAATDGLPDARSRLQYIADKTGQAAEKVLTLVDEAKAERGALADSLKQMAATPDAHNATALAQADARLQLIDAKLTEIMLAQDFHDLTGQVVKKVVLLASDLEDSLVKLLVQAAPGEVAPKPAAPAARLEGPVVAPEGRTDVATSQGEVDDLLASLGF